MLPGLGLSSPLSSHRNTKRDKVQFHNGVLGTGICPNLQIQYNLSRDEITSIKQFSLGLCLHSLYFVVFSEWWCFLPE